MPALLNRMSIGPNAAATSCAKARLGSDIDHIERAMHRTPPKRADLVRRLLGLSPIVEMAERDVGALCREGERRCPADAARSASDQRNLSCKLHRIASSVRRSIRSTRHAGRSMPPAHHRPKAGMRRADRAGSAARGSDGNTPGASLLTQTAPSSRTACARTPRATRGPPHRRAPPNGTRQASHPLEPVAHRRQVVQQIALNDTRRIAPRHCRWRRAGDRSRSACSGHTSVSSQAQSAASATSIGCEIKAEPPHDTRMHRGQRRCRVGAAREDRRIRGRWRQSALPHSRSHSDRAAGTDRPTHPLRAAPAAAAVAPEPAAAWRNGRLHWSACGVPTSYARTAGALSRSMVRNAGQSRGVPHT